MVGDDRSSNRNMAWLKPLELEPLMTATFRLQRGIDIGRGPFGRRMVIQVDEGAFEFVNSGPFSGVRGIILRGSADYALYGVDNQTLQVDVRAILETTFPKDVRMLVEYTNWVRLSPLTIDRVERGELEIDFTRSRFITQPRFEVLEPEQPRPDRRFDFKRLSWTPLVAHGALSRRQIKYRIYEVVNRYAPESVSS